MTNCVYASNTPLGTYCTLCDFVCIPLECDEPKWEYLLRLAEEENEQS
jgi:hypothetical protein